MPGIPLLARLPDALGALGELATNLWFSWNPDAQALFARLDRVVWDAVGHDPVATLARLPQDALRAAAADPAYVAELARVHGRMREELTATDWYGSEHPADGDALIAYFSCEFGLDASLPIYSGGLGILAGDHLKSASELGVPLVGVGLLYEKGYFRQAITPDGRQSERYPANDPEGMAVSLERKAGGAPIEVVVELGGEPVRVQIWRAQVGRVRLLLLDSDVEGNSSRARAVTGTLYGGDREMRIRQEVLLGVGGVRALAALGLGADGLPPERGALRVPGAGAPAGAAGRRRGARGRARAGARLVGLHHPHAGAGGQRGLRPGPRRCATWAAWPWRSGSAPTTCWPWAAIGPDDPGFGMTPLALRTSARANGVSALHGEVSREMWRPALPGPAGGRGADRPRHQRGPSRARGSTPRSTPISPTPSSGRPTGGASGDWPGRCVSIRTP